MILPSKELLSEVLGISKYLLLSFHIRDNQLHLLLQGNTIYNTENTIKNNHKIINIYELAHKCKEWSFKQDYFILESAYVPNGEFTSSYCKADQKFSHPTKKQTFYADTEPECIFLACEWLLKEMKI